jgi:hypothetical protein
MWAGACDRAWRAVTRSTEAATAVALSAPSGVDVASARGSSEGGVVMSQTGVEKVVEQLLADENLRIRFALDRIETIAELGLRGFDLSREDVDLFCRTDARLWFLGGIACDERPQ